LLKNCLSLPKLYILRTAPVYRFREILRSFDEVIRVALSNITNIDMSDAVWSQTSLPVCYGGLGIRRTEDLALPAYLALVHFVLPFISGIHSALPQDDLTQNALLEWSNLLGNQL